MRFRIAKAWRKSLFIAFLGLCLGVKPGIGSAACTEGACFTVGGAIASVDSTRGPLLNAVMTALLGSSVNITVGTWDGLAQGNVDLAGVINALQADLSLATPEQVLSANVTLLQLLDATVAALEADGKTVEADLVRTVKGALISVPGISATVPIGTLLVVDFPVGSLIDIDIGLFDLVVGSIQLFNYENVVTTSPLSVTLNPLLGLLGLTGIVDDLSIQLQVIEPPSFGCGPTGTTFRTAAVRLKQHFSLVNDTDTGLLGALTVDLTVLDMDLYVEVGQASGTLTAADAATGTVSVQPQHALVDLYLGQIADQDFFDRTHTLNPATDLGTATVGTVSVGLLGVLGLEAKAHATGDDPFPALLNFLAPFPGTKTATSSTLTIANLLDDPVEGDGLLQNLELSFTGVLSSTVDMVALTALVQGMFEGLVWPVLAALLTNVVDPLLELLGVAIGETSITVFGTGGVCDVTGFLYRDFNPEDGAKSAGEDWTDGPSVFVNVVRAGAVLRSVAVTGGTGTVTLTDLPLGNYTVVVTDEAASTVAAAPSRWPFAAPSSGSVALSLPSDGAASLDFGFLRLPSLVRGTVFVDIGAGGGTANDAVRNGTETGLGSVTVRLIDDATESILAETVTDAMGAFAVTVPDTSAGTTVRVQAVDPAGFLSIGGTPGSTLGTYTLAPDAVAFVPGLGIEYTDLAFADVPVSRLSGGGEATAQPGGVRHLAHDFIAGSAAQVDFAAAVAAQGDNAGGNAVVLHDLDCSGTPASDEPVLAGPVAVTPAQRLCLLVKVFAPADGPPGATFGITLSAAVTLTTQVSEALQAGSVLRLVLPDGTLILIKRTVSATAAPGDVITYTIDYANAGDAPIDSVVINDFVPSFTAFDAAGCGALATGLTGCTITAPAVGARGDVVWTFQGVLAPGATGSVNLSVRVEN